MGRGAGTGIAIAAVAGILTGGVGAVAAASAAGVSISSSAVITAAIFNGAIGAGVASLGLLTRKKPSTNRAVDDTMGTTSIRNLPVPVLFGRGRLSGNYLALGFFHEFKTKAEDNGARVYQMHAILGLAEGELQAAGNYTVDGKMVRNLTDVDEPGEQKPADWSDAELEARDVGPQGLSHADLFRFHLYGGTNDETVPDMVLDVGQQITAGFTAEVDGVRRNITSQDLPVPWRNTAKLAVKAFVGFPAHMAQITADAMGADLTIRRSGSTGGTNFEEVPLWAYYDAYTECFWYTLDSAGGIAGNLGIARIGRTGDSGHQHTAPPTDMGASAEKGWFLGKHDIVVFQDPADSAAFWVGSWGLAPGSSDWHKRRPDPAYSNGIAINGEYLDERHGILHTLHDDGTIRYILRWHLLQGTVDKLDTDLPTGPYYAFMYSADFDAYFTATEAGFLYMTTADTGESIRESEAVNLNGCVGLCVAGARVGIIKTDAFVYWNPHDDSVEALGADGVGLDAGNFGATISARQNSWTGHVTLAKPYSTPTTVAFVNFLPSIVEDMEDVSANGSPRGVEFQWDYDVDAEGNATSTVLFPKDEVAGWVRDWSYRTYNEYDLVALEGNSSWAAACWAMLVDEPTLDTARWGAGLPSRYFSLSSFESVHAYCVGGVLHQNPRKPRPRRTVNTQYEIAIGGTGGIGCCWDLGDVNGSHVLDVVTPPDGWEYAWQDEHWILYGVAGKNGNGGKWRLKMRCQGQITFENDGGITPTDGTWVNVWSSAPIGLECTGKNLSLNAIVALGGGPVGGGEFPITYRFAERVKFDLLIDSESSPATLLVEEFLAAVNGHCYMVGGVLHVGVERPGTFPAWSFSAHTIVDGGVTVAMAGGRDRGVNRVRVQYTKVRDDYRKDFAEANDEHDQLARRRVIPHTLSLNSIARNGHAEWLAHMVMSQLQASRRHLTFKVPYIGLLFTPADTLRVTYGDVGINQVLVKAISLKEEVDLKGQHEFEIKAQEHRPILSLLRDVDTGDPNDPVVDPPNDPTDPGECEPARAGTGTGVVWFDDQNIYIPGTYIAKYLEGAYRASPDGFFLVEGYDVVTKNAAGDIVVLAAAPAVANPADGYTTAAAAEAANAGQESSITLSVAGPIGIRLRHPPAFSNHGPEGNPLYELCLDEPCATCDCDEDCTEPANCGECWYSIDSVLKVDYGVNLNGNSAMSLPPIAQLLLPFMGLENKRVRWHEDYEDGSTADAELECATRQLTLVHEATDGARWAFRGTMIECSRGSLTLDVETSNWLNKASSTTDPDGDAGVELESNPNPDTGEDCETAKPCGQPSGCDFDLQWSGGNEGYNRTLYLAHLYDDLAPGATLRFSVMWDSDTIPDRLIVKDALGATLIDSGCSGTNVTHPPGGETFYEFELTEAEADGVTIEVIPNCGTPTGQTGWHLRFKCEGEPPPVEPITCDPDEAPGTISIGISDADYHEFDSETCADNGVPEFGIASMNDTSQAVTQWDPPGGCAGVCWRGLFHTDGGGDDPDTEIGINCEPDELNPDKVKVTAAVSGFYAGDGWSGVTRDLSDLRGAVIELTNSAVYEECPGVTLHVLRIEIQ